MLLPGSGGAGIAYLITGGELVDASFKRDSETLLRKAKDAIRSKIDFIQIREKKLSARNLFYLTQDIVALSKDSETRILVNERLDVAIAAFADGVHLTSKSIGVRNARTVCPAGFLIGVSTHTLEEVGAARKEGADYALFGPVFDTPSKREYGTAKGIQELSRVCAEMKGFPVIGLGGIDLQNWHEVLNAGAAGFAGIRMFDSPDAFAPASV